MFVRTVTFLVEAFPAELADKRFVPRVDPHVSVERGAPVERFPTLVTLVRLFLSGRSERRDQEDEIKVGM